MALVQQNEEWRRLHQRLRGIAKRRAALDAEEARCLREAYETKLWRRFGYAHINEYLERALGYSPQVGVERLRVALALAELPQIEASLADGALPYSAVRELTRVANAETEQAWLYKALGKSLREIEQMVSGRKRGDRPEDPANPDLVMRVVRLELAPAVFAMFRQVRSAMADEHGGHLDDSAVMEILCRRALEGGECADRPPYQIAFTVCDACGRGWQNGAGREIEVPREVIDRARCDAEEIGSLSAEQPERARTTVTPRVRRQVLARDQHRCTVPGCRSARNLDLHHIEYRQDGGSNEMGNLTIVCSAHHQSLHDGLLTIRGRAPHALTFSWRESGAEHVSAADTRAASAAGGAGAQVGSASAPIDEHRQRAVDTNGQRERLTRRWVPYEVARDRPSADEIDDDARSALVKAGYKVREARDAVRRARPHVGADATLNQVVREALRQCIDCRVPTTG
jgi:hypothetical protein